MRIVGFLILLVFCINAFADEVRLSWLPSSTREDGSAITGEITYQLYQENVLVYEGVEVEYTTNVTDTVNFELYQLEDGRRSKAHIKTIIIRKYPPNAPRFN